MGKRKPTELELRENIRKIAAARLKYLGYEQWEVDLFLDNRSNWTGVRAMNANYIRNRLSNIRDAAYRANRALENGDSNTVEKELCEIEQKVQFIRENLRNKLEK